MPHEIRFKTVPVEVAELLQEKLDGALQLVAALVLTDEEVVRLKTEVDPKTRPENMLGWAAGMREELLSDEWRPTLVEALRRHAFLTNTHPGFPLGALEQVVPQTYLLADAFADLERMLQEYADGKGEEVQRVADSSRKDWEQVFRAYWVSRLVAAGHHKVVANWCMKRIGYSLALEARMNRLVGEAEARKKAAGETPGV